jgi:hypothetical protein
MDIEQVDSSKQNNRKSQPSATSWYKYHVLSQETPGTNFGVKNRDRVKEQVD